MTSGERFAIVEALAALEAAMALLRNALVDERQLALEALSLAQGRLEGVIWSRMEEPS